MTDKLQIDLVGAEQLLQRLDAAIAMLDSPAEMLDAIGAQLETNINLRFDMKVDASGAAWAPLAETTLELYERKYQGNIPGSLLERTRHMRNSLTHNASDDFVEVGFSVDYAGYHVTGTKKMPRRDPIFGTVNDEGTEGQMCQEDEQDVLSIIEIFLTDALDS